MSVSPTLLFIPNRPDGATAAKFWFAMTSLPLALAAIFVSTPNQINAISAPKYATLWSHQIRMVSASVYLTSGSTLIKLSVMSAIWFFLNVCHAPLVLIALLSAVIVLTIISGTLLPAFLATTGIPIAWNAHKMARFVWSVKLARMWIQELVWAVVHIALNAPIQPNAWNVQMDHSKMVRNVCHVEWLTARHATRQIHAKIVFKVSIWPQLAG